jgi:hypothetical protein
MLAWHCALAYCGTLTETEFITHLRRLHLPPPSRGCTVLFFPLLCWPEVGRVKSFGVHGLILSGVTAVTVNGANYPSTYLGATQQPGDVYDTSTIQ